LLNEVLFISVVLHDIQGRPT